jgi:hypothetical protein
MVTNVLAHYTTMRITAVKSFMIQVLGNLNFISNSPNIIELPNFVIFIEDFGLASKNGKER